jgi:hypothetical protein
VAATHAEQVKAAFAEGTTVFVAPARAKLVDGAATQRLAAQIDDRAGERIHIAVVPAGWVKEEGTVADFANAVAGDLRGAVLVEADGKAHVVTSYEDTDAAVSAVQNGFESADDEPQQLAEVIDNLAAADPGRAGDLDGGDSSSAPTFTIPNLPDANKIVDDVTSTIKFVVIAIVLVILAPFLFLLLRGISRARREHVLDAERLQDARAALEEQRAKLGDDIVDLDAATSMPNVPDGARKDYELALEAYDSSAAKLAAADSASRVSAVQKIIADGRAAAARARNAVGGNG